MNKNIYSLCLVTDRIILKNISLEQAVEQSILGGASMIQLREKNITTEEFLSIARKIKQITDKYDIPLIINDNVEIALKIDASGVHLGQNDMNIIKAREILGNDKIIGLSISSIKELQNSLNYPVDYYGVGPIYNTISKSDANEPIGLETLIKIRKLTAKPIIAIGGIDEYNAKNIFNNQIDGIAIISNILKNNEIKKNTQKLKNIFNSSLLMQKLDKKIEKIRNLNPLIYHLTNTVTINDCANITLAIGGSPLMSFCYDELEEIIKISSALVLNIGTMEKNMIDMALDMGKLANRYNKPIILDPVGVGATTARKNLIEKLMNTVKFNVIKGNLSEIKSILNLKNNTKGVDSFDISLDEEIIEIGKIFYDRYKTVLCITGKIDYIFFKNNVVKIHNGHKNMCKVTGTGCMSASLVGTFLGSEDNDFLNAILGVSIMGIAGEIASKSSEQYGTGTLKIKLIDTVSKINSQLLMENIQIEHFKI